MIYMENHAKQRYYLLFTEQDLFGTWCLIKAFGSLVSYRGRTITQVCLNQEQALNDLFDAESKKRQRGYNYADLIHTEQLYLRPQTVKEIMAQKKIQPSKPKISTVPEKKTHNPNQQDLFQGISNA